MSGAVRVIEAGLVIVAALVLTAAGAGAVSPSLTAAPASATLPLIAAGPGDVLTPAVPPAPGPLPAPVVGIPAAALGLVPGDVISSLSFGLAGLPTPSPGLQVLFSVAPGSVGGAFIQPPANLSCEKTVGQAAGDIYLAQPYGPALPLPNVLALDGNGVADSACGPVPAPGLGLLEPSTDDVSAIELYPPQFVFADGALIGPVYFTLAPSSPTLVAIGAGASDILFASPPGFATPGIALRGDLGLGLAVRCAPGIGAPACDEIDAMEFLLPEAAFISLAPGSPSLVGCGFTANDILLGPPAGPPPCFLILPGTMLGLGPADNLDALALHFDTDGDFVADPDPMATGIGDNCVTTPNNDQLDGDGDGVGDACDTSPACPVTAIGGCEVPGRSILIVKDAGMDGATAKDKLVWKWLDGPATMQADFGDPTTTAGYTLCIYDGAGALQIEANVPAGTSWSPIGSAGYRYVDAPSAADGVGKVVLKGNATAAKSKIRVHGKGAGLDIDAGTLPLDDGADIVLQLHNGANANCWSASFSPASVLRNGEDYFKAKTP